MFTKLFAKNVFVLTLGTLSDNNAALGYHRKTAL